MAVGESAGCLKTGPSSLVCARKTEKDVVQLQPSMEEKGNCFLFMSCVRSGREEITVRGPRMHVSYTSLTPCTQLAPWKPLASSHISCVCCLIFKFTCRHEVSLGNYLVLDLLCPQLRRPLCGLALATHIVPPY
jgi:hypothetical protein